MAKVVSPDPGQLLIAMPAIACGPTEELAIAVIWENFFHEVARMLNREGAGVTGLRCNFLLQPLPVYTEGKAIVIAGFHIS